MKTRETPAELAAYISLELRETEIPRLSYDDWTVIKAALRAYVPMANSRRLDDTEKR